MNVKNLREQLKQNGLAILDIAEKLFIIKFEAMAFFKWLDTETIDIDAKIICNPDKFEQARNSIRKVLKFEAETYVDPKLLRVALSEYRDGQPVKLQICRLVDTNQQVINISGEQLATMIMQMNGDKKEYFEPWKVEEKLNEVQTHE